MSLKIKIELPEEFREHWQMDHFYDSLKRIETDISEENGLSGLYELELIGVLINAFKNSKS